MSNEPMYTSTDAQVLAALAAAGNLVQSAEQSLTKAKVLLLQAKSMANNQVVKAKIGLAAGSAETAKQNAKQSHDMQSLATTDVMSMPVDVADLQRLLQPVGWQSEPPAQT